MSIQNLVTRRAHQANIEIERKGLIDLLPDFEHQSLTRELYKALAEDKPFNIQIANPIILAIDGLKSSPNSLAACRVEVDRLTLLLDQLVAVAFYKDAVSYVISAYVEQRGPGAAGLITAINRYAGAAGIQRYITCYEEQLSMIHLDMLLASIVYETGVDGISTYVNLLTSLGCNLLTAVVETNSVERFITLGSTTENSVFRPLRLMLQGSK